MQASLKPSLKQRALQALGHWNGIRGTDRLLRTFAHPDRQRSTPFEVDFFGVPYTGNLANFIDWWVFYYGAFALHEITLLADLAKALRAEGKPVNFYDIGANIGHHTLFMSRHADRCFAFEPFSVVREEMARKLAHAAVANVTIFPVAVGDRTESGTFHPPTGANQGTGTLAGMLPDNASSETISVEVVRGDDFFAAQGLPPVSLVKMDVEGYELKVLEGLRETFWRDRPPILLEVQRTHETTADLLHGRQFIDLLYPDHVLYEVATTHRGKYILKPFSLGTTEEALVLPKELVALFLVS